MATTSRELEQELPELPELEAAPRVIEPVQHAATAFAAVAADEAAKPSDRIRFSAVARLRVDDSAGGGAGVKSGAPVEAAIVNLSSTGVACLASEMFRCGQGVWVSFELNLGEAPLHLLAAVIWRQPRDEHLFLYGLRFQSVSAHDELRLQAVLKERTEGKAGAWPLPVIPEPTAPPERRGLNPYLTALGGMAAGISLALAFTAIPRPRARSAALAVSEPLAMAPNAAAQKQDPVEALTPRPPAPVAAAPVAAAPVATAPVAAAPVAAAPRHQASAVEPVSNAQLLIALDGGAVELVLPTDGPVDDHVAFWLDSPRRLVIDIPNRHTTLAGLEYPLAHPLVSQLRVGRYKDKVRFVIEADATVSDSPELRRDGNNLVVALRKGA